MTPYELPVPIALRCIFNLFFLQFFCAGLLYGQKDSRAVISADFADPTVIKAQGKFYATGTSSEWAPHFPIYASTDLLNWAQTGYIFDQTPTWTSGSFWAPEYFFHHGTYFLYYTARRKSDNISCIGVATSPYPDRGFMDKGIIVEHGKEAIDAFVFNDNGQLYMTYKAYGLDDRPIEILGSKLSSDGLQLEGEVFSLLKDNQGNGIEGQSFLKKGGYYYMFYSAGGCCGLKCSYNVRVARSKNFKGPYVDFDGNPILKENAAWDCAGHGTFVAGTDGKNYYLYHAYNKKSNVFVGRQGMLAELKWSGKEGWPTLTEYSGPEQKTDIKDDFNTKSLQKYWQWDFRHADPRIKQLHGRLYLSGKINANNRTGLVLAVRPATNLFEAKVTVTNTNSGLKGLAYYGDANAALGIGVAGDSVVLWIVKDNMKSNLASAKIKSGQMVDLKISLLADLSCEVAYKQENGDWKSLVPKEKILAVFLPQWDRSPRIGLHYNGPEGAHAEFSSFRLTHY
ncbi:glycoside hydrolase family 43 protein [Pedobacter immunditicola]|uniref:glycoside hydrolase family 43 protein n=1 Tax=Pedobacter immunditicola TaxID=3133440 RepID=UPI00309C26E1